MSNKKSSFSALPNKWIRELQLKSFKHNEKSGESISALKCLLVLNYFMDFKTKETLDISYTRLVDLTSLSRPMIAKGIKALLDKNIIEIAKKTPKGSQYRFLTEDERWSKVPKYKLLNFIENTSNRGISSLSSLKIYLTLLTIRMNNSNDVKISYDRIRDYTGLQSKQIRSGLQVLFEYKLIGITQELDLFTRKYESNSYKVLNIET